MITHLRQTFTSIANSMSDLELMISKEFARDIHNGFSQSPKQLSSKYFYDDRGSQLFAEIMNLEEYYLTDCEYEIFDTKAKEIIAAFLKDADGINLIELGAGNGLKTKLLLHQLSQQGANFEYSPIDISEEAMQSLKSHLRADYPNMKINPLTMDYFKALDILEQQADKRKVVMFLGANIGNYTQEEALDLFQQIKARLQPGDMIFTGFDLKKDPKIILKAYDDAKGITQQFNLNLLARMNKELGANFDLNAFDHYAIYEPLSGEARSYLVSLKDQDIHFDAVDKTYTFQKWELIHTEISRKFDIHQIDSMATTIGFQVVKHFKDKRQFFTDSLWQL